MPVAGVGPHLSSSVKDAVGVSTSTAFFFLRSALSLPVESSESLRSGDISKSGRNNRPA